MPQGQNVTPESHLLLGNSLSPIFSPCPFLTSALWGNKKWFTMDGWVKMRNIFWNKISLAGCKWSNFNATGSETPVSHSLLGDSLFPIFSPCSLLPSSLWGNKKWFIIEVLRFRPWIRLRSRIYSHFGIPIPDPGF